MVDTARSTEEDGSADRGRPNPTSSAGILVGRERELSELVACLDDASVCHGRLVLLAGEPGIGKSRLVDELAAEARERGARILWGRCWEEGGAPPYWPWVQSLRAYVRATNPEELRRHLGQGAADVVQMLPEIRQSLPDVGEALAGDPDAARFRLFDSTTAVLRSIADDGLLLLVLEDLHAADTPSLILLQFLARSIGDLRLMIVATYRDVEVGRGHPLAAALVEMAREPTTRRLTLTGLTPPDVRRFIESTSGVSPSQALVDAVAQQTDGNPLFVGEIVKLLAAEGRLSGETAGPLKPIPQTVRDVIGRRLGHVSERCNHILGIASVLGRDFRLDVLARVSEQSGEELLDILDEATVARLVEESPSSGRRRFSHSLIRDALYEEISASRRVRLHRRAAEVIEESSATRTEHLGELAHHCFAAIPLGDADRAVHYAMRAAEAALAGLAFEESARLYRMALAAMDLGEAGDDAARYDILIALGDALNRAGDADAARREFLAATAIARRRGDADALARAVLGYGGRLSWAALRGDVHFVPLLEEAITALGDQPTPLRVMVMGRLAAGPLRDSGDPTRRWELSEQALIAARGLGDPATLAYALEARLGAVMGPDSLTEMVRICNELEALGAELGDPEKVVMAHMQRCLVRLVEGDMRAIRLERDGMARAVQQLQQGPQRWFLLGTDATLAILAGRYDEAERLSVQAYEAGRHLESFVLFAHRLQVLWIRIEQGRTADVAPMFRESLEPFRPYPLWRAALPWLLLHYGTREQARAALDDALSEQRPAKEDWLIGEALLAHAAATLADQPAAALLDARLRPYADLIAADIPDLGLGSMHRPLGRLAAVLGRVDDAEGHFRAAIAADDRMGARPSAARSRHEWAQLLVGRRGAGDTHAAIELLEASVTVAHELGMGPLEADAGALLAAIAEAPPASLDDSADSPPDDGTFALEGEYWTIAYEGRVVRLRDTKGMRVLARLLAEPQRPHPSLDLERVDNHDDAALARACAAGDAGELVDDEARRAYRARIAELRTAIADAEMSGRAEAVALMREEVDHLARELNRAVGFGGRSRRAGSITERARLNVTRAVKSSMRRISDADPGLAAHLDATVHTGTVCVYSPDPRSTMVWRVTDGNGRRPPQQD